MVDLQRALLGALAGELDRFVELRHSTHEALSQAASKLSTLVLQRDGLAAAIRSWQSGAHSPDVIQAWASFMRRGYVSGMAAGTTRPLHIEFAENDENQLAEVISRLDELGDTVDGTIDREEVSEMLERLSD